jgi:hypothetical protein
VKTTLRAIINLIYSPLSPIGICRQGYEAQQTAEPVEANRVDDLWDCSTRSFFLNLISLMPGVQETILFWLSRLMLPDATRIMETWVQNVFVNRSGDLISFG